MLTNIDVNIYLKRIYASKDQEWDLMAFTSYTQRNWVELIGRMKHQKNYAEKSYRKDFWYNWHDMWLKSVW